MIAAIDVSYNEPENRAKAAAVIFNDFSDTEPVAEYVKLINGINEYVPGRFFQRELPCLLQIIQTIKEPIDTVIIDGYVQLDDQPGLGMYLWGALEHRIKIIGVAKSKYRDVDAVELYRGKSKNPLYITATGLESLAAADQIKRMPAADRTPALLKRADRLSKQL